MAILAEKLREKDILPVLTVVRRLFTIHKKCFRQFLSDFNFVWFV